MILGRFLVITLFLIGVPSADAQTPEERIRTEGLQRSQVMDIASQITDGVGPRLTNSPGIRTAQVRVLADLKSWGVTGRLEEWSDFGRGWELTGLTAEQRAPAYTPLIAYAKAWSPGTSGMLEAEPVYFDAADKASVQGYRAALALPTTSPWRRPACRASPSFEVSWRLAAVQITPTWMSTTGCCPPTCNRLPS